LWLTKEENVQPTHKDLRAEKGVYIFWDPASWSKVSREFVLAYDALEERTVGVNQAPMTGNGQQQQQSQGGPTQQSQQQTPSQVPQIST
jgi:CCR4-NOT transcription complex subunit 2